MHRPIPLLLLAFGPVVLCPAESLAQALLEAPPFEPSSVAEADPTPPPGERSILPAPATTPDAKPTGAVEAERVEAAASSLVEAIRANHRWARFEPGAWRTLRTVSEAFDGEGAFAGRSLTERTERLVAVDDTTYTLEVETVIALAGRSTPGPAETIQYRLLNDRPVELGVPRVVEDEPTSISLGEVMASCRVWRLTEETPAGIEERTVYVSEEASPMVLRRESQTTTAAGDVGTQRVMSITRRNCPVLHGGRLANAWHATSETLHEAEATTERYTIGGPDVPGGIYRESVLEFGASGKKSRWAVSELVASGRSAKETIGPAKEGSAPGVEIEIHPRRLLRMLRRGEASPKEL